jgi:alanine racemase
MRATRAVIRLDNLRHNIHAVKRHVGGSVPLCMAVKADAYGHGAISVAREALKAGVTALGVATVDEGLELRGAGISAPVFLFSLPAENEIEALVEAGLIPFCAGRDFIILCSKQAQKQGRTLEVHLKVDTGMGRIGCTPEEAPELSGLIASLPGLTLGGICTHFPVSDSSDPEYTLGQVRVLKRVIERVREAGVDPGIVHAANSGAIVDKPETYFDMVRPGIILYGYYPSHSQQRPIDVRPVMELLTQIGFLKRVPKGTSVSYGRTYTTNAETWIATLPLGYADGYNRRLSNRSQVLINGRRYPLAGRVCMDQVMVDLGPVTDLEVGRDVVMFGADPGGPDAEEIADLLDTIPYEITCLITKRVPRVYVGGETE